MIKGYRKLRKDEKIKEYDMFFRQSEDILVPVYSEWVGTGAIKDFIYRPIKKHENKYSYPKRIDLEGIIGTSIFNAVKACAYVDSKERHEIIVYHTKHIINLIQNNYRRRKKG